MRTYLVPFLLAGACACAGASAQTNTKEAAQAAPKAQQMIDALSGKTRSMRNLGVEAAPQPAPAGPGGIDPSNMPMPPLARPGGGAVAAPAAAPAPARPAPAPVAATPARPAPAPAPAAEPEGGAIDLALRFEFNSDRLVAEDRATLNELATALRSPELAGRRFLIEGHTDNQGSAAYNLRLSRQRAQAVRAILVAARVPADRLRAEGRGSEDPADPAHPEAPENRRVRIVSTVH